MDSFKKPLLLAAFLLLCGVEAFGGIFNTSKCFDLLCTPQYIDHIKEDSRFTGLCADSVFMANINEINSNSSASKLCNLYAELKGDKNDIQQCLATVQHLDSLARDIEWAGAILSVRPQLSYVLQRLIENGWADYWEQTIYPKLKSHIDNYHLNQNLLDSIHSSMADFFRPDSLADSQSKIFILNIENAFNLSDESFCCTPLILDPEIIE